MHKKIQNEKHCAGHRSSLEIRSYVKMLTEELPSPRVMRINGMKMKIFLRQLLMYLSVHMDKHDFVQMNLTAGDF